MKKRRHDISGLQARKELTLEQLSAEIASIDEEIKKLNTRLQATKQRMVLYKNRLKKVLNEDEDEEHSEVGSV